MDARAARSGRGEPEPGRCSAGRAGSAARCPCVRAGSLLPPPLRERCAGWDGGLLLLLLSGTFFPVVLRRVVVLHLPHGLRSCRAGSGWLLPSGVRPGPCPSAPFPTCLRSRGAPGWGCPCAPRPPARRGHLPHPHFPRSLQLRGEAPCTCNGRGMRRGYLRARRCRRKFPSS